MFPIEVTDQSYNLVVIVNPIPIASVILILVVHINPNLLVSIYPIPVVNIKPHSSSKYKFPITIVSIIHTFQ